MKFHRDGTKPMRDEIFVFGSNLAGIHGAGAALEAKRSFGAIQGNGIGYCNYSYAIPTKDHNIQTMSLGTIKPYIDAFLVFARENPNTEFWLTRVGCGLAGYDDSDIAPMFCGASENCSFPDKWKKILESC
jgi:hypothetical protein